MSRIRIPRWYFVYFILAAFNVVVIGASLLITDHLLTDYTESVDQVKLLTYNQNLLIDLDDIIAKMNQPGNDVFTSRDPDAEEARLTAYTSEFDEHLTLLRNKLVHDFTPSQYAQIEEALVKAQLNSAQATEAAQQVFTLYRQGNVAAASNSMAQMDAAHSEVDDAVGEAIKIIGDLLKDDLNHQIAHASEIRSVETALMILAVMVIAGTAYYGYTVAQRLKRDIEERQKTAEELARHRDHLEELVKAQTSTIRRESEQNILMRNITEIANSAASLETALQQVMDELCAYTDFPIAHCYLYDPELQMLTSSDVWSSLAREQFPEFIEKTRATTASASTLPGYVVQERMVRWIRDIRVSDLFVLSPHATANGIQTAIGVPVMTDQRLFGVLEMFHTAACERDGTLVSILEYAAVQLARVIERFQYQQNIRKAQRDAEAASEAKSDFLANMSHELRTPLNSIIGMASLLLEERVTPGQREMLETMNYSSKNLLEIVNDVIDFSKIESGRLELEHIPFNIEETIAKTVDMLMPIASGKGLELTLHVATTVPHVMGDPTRTARIVTNLVGNAIKYTERGSVDVRLTFEEMGEQAITLRLDVIDTGIGIPENKLSAVFEKFVQADTSTTRKYGGSGLGLAITKQLVEAMNGAVSVQSTVGEGSTFTVILPLTLADEAVNEHLTQHSNFACGTLPVARTRVLIAEDHPMNQAFMKKLLPSIGITQFTLAENGKEALDLVIRGECDIVLMDCHMPEMNGYDATKAIRAHEESSGMRIPIVAMTANAMMGERERCLAYGMDEYISKPVSKPQLMEILSNWIRFEDKPKDVVTAAVDAQAILDLSILRTITEGNLSMERDFAQTFYEQSKLNLDKLSGLCIDGISQPWKEAAHSLKGGAATMGAMRLRAVAADAQEMLDARHEDRSAILKQLQIEFNAACTALAKEQLLDRRGEAA